MFLWLKIIGLNDTRHLVETRCLEKLVILAPGYAFATKVDSPSPYIRVSYSIASPEEVDLVNDLLLYFLTMLLLLYKKNNIIKESNSINKVYYTYIHINIYYYFVSII